MKFFLFVFLFFNLSHAQDLDTDLETAPNEPPYNLTEEQKAAEDAAMTEELELEQEDPRLAEKDDRGFVPKWKQVPRSMPSEDRLKQLNEEHGLFKITKKKEYLYDTKKTPQDSAMGLRFGAMSMANIRNPTANVTYQDIYKSSNAIGAFFDYEWQFFRSAGKLGLKFGLGFAGGKGNGRFQSDPSGGVWGLNAMEVYSFYLLPLSAGLVYRFDYFNKQILVPYVEGGADYYVFGEFRNDGHAPNFGATPLFHIAGGLAFLLDWISPNSMVAMDKDHGINHLYLTAEYRILQRISGRFDFSDQILSGGFMVEY